MDEICDSMFGEAQNIGALRAQSLTSLGGKLLRIDPATGHGICTGSNFKVKNPFCTNDPTDISSKIYALGFRNPFQITISPPPADASGIAHMHSSSSASLQMDLEFQ